MAGLEIYMTSDVKIIMYKNIQTGANSQSGGAKKGLFKFIYQRELYILIFLLYSKLLQLPNVINLIQIN